jgi:hypothetical protein
MKHEPGIPKSSSLIIINIFTNRLTRLCTKLLNSYSHYSYFSNAPPVLATCLS